MSVQVDIKGIDKAVVELAGTKRRVHAAIKSATGRALTAGRTAISKGIRSEYSVKASTIKNAIRKQRENAGMGGRLIVSGRPIDLMEFFPNISRAGMVSVRIKKARKKLPHSFFVSTKKAGIYHRLSAKRLPIGREFTLSVPQMAGNTKVSKQVQDRMQEVFEERLLHALAYGEGRYFK